MRSLSAIVLGLVVVGACLGVYHEMLQVLNTAPKLAAVGIAVVLGLGFWALSQPRARYVVMESPPRPRRATT